MTTVKYHTATAGDMEYEAVAIEFVELTSGWLAKLYNQHGGTTERGTKKVISPRALIFDEELIAFCKGAMCSAKVGGPFMFNEPNDVLE